MKFFYAALLLLLCVNTKAADTLTTNFINSISHQMVSPKAKYYHLYTYGKNPDKDMLGRKVRLDDNHLRLNKGFDEKIPFNDFREAIKIDTSTINWLNFNLKNARIVDEKHLSDYEHGKIIKMNVPYDCPTSILIKLRAKGIQPQFVKMHISTSELQKLANRVKDYNQLPAEETTCYLFSKPIFSKKHDYVLIAISSLTSGSFHVFKLVNGIWKDVFDFGEWTI